VFLLRIIIQDACGAYFMYSSTIIGDILRKSFTTRVVVTGNMPSVRKRAFSFKMNFFPVIVLIQY
jgi:hypothetical protein